jgi:small subunit ribosomal protein S24e
MSDYQVRLRKLMKNPLLKRRQFVVEVLHPGKANVSKAALVENLAKSMKVSNPKTIVLFGFRSAFGGGKSTGFGLIYDDTAALMKFEPKYRKVRGGFLEAKEGSMKLKKENKNKAKKSRGTGRWQAKRRAKRAAEE